MSDEVPGAGAPSTERRLGDRRRVDRRGGQGIGSSQAGPGAAAQDAGSEAAQERWPEAEPGTPAESPFERITRTYLAARMALATLLLAMQAALAVAGVQPAEWASGVMGLYTMQATALWWVMRARKDVALAKERHARARVWMASIGVDLVAFSLLHALSTGASLNYAALLVLPVLMAGVLMARRWALFAAATAALMLLAATWPRSLSAIDSASVIAQAGVVGLGLFVIAYLAGEFALRLRREEQVSRRSLELARTQTRLNRLVIEEMADGVLVVDRRYWVHAANPAARRLLVSQGEGPPAPFSLRARPEWQALREAVEEATRLREWPEAGRDLTLPFADQAHRALRVRARLTASPVSPADEGMPDAYCVLLLEDVRTAQARLRQERLAAMGRVSTGIAHEIRNPLAAIAQANALLMESPLSGSQEKLSRIVLENARRLQRVVDDVLQAALPFEAQPPTIDATAEVAVIVREWRYASGEASDTTRIQTDLPSTPLPVLFDGEHLRRVIVNLLDNAARHASADPGAIVLRLSSRDDLSAILSVSNDGEAIAPEVEKRLFEPFFSTRSRGSGLGLYICRELCERNGASIEYRGRPPTELHRSGFVLVMRRVSAA